MASSKQREAQHQEVFPPEQRGERDHIAAGKPTTMLWPFPPPDGFKRVGRNMIAEKMAALTDKPTGSSH